MIQNHFLSKHTARMNCFKVFAFCIFVIATHLVSSHSFASYADAVERCQISTAYQANSIFETFSKHPSSSTPWIPSPTPIEIPSPDERDSTDWDDYQLTKLCGNLSLSFKGSLHSKKSLFVELTQSIENRSSISLFILYQCWKSFL
jgi:hypothetical protein